jgi:hypothetical protein
MYFRYVYMVGQIFLGGIFLLAVIAGIRSWVWKAIWIVAAGCLWYFAGLFFAAPLILAVIVRIATTVASSTQSIPAKDGATAGS